MQVMRSEANLSYAGNYSGKLDVVNWKSALVMETHGTGINEELDEKTFAVKESNPVKAGLGISQ